MLCSKYLYISGGGVEQQRGQHAADALDEGGRADGVAPARLGARAQAVMAVIEPQGGPKVR